jgi:hypothetical protein
VHNTLTVQGSEFEILGLDNNIDVSRTLGFGVWGLGLGGMTCASRTSCKLSWMRLMTWHLISASNERMSATVITHAVVVVMALAPRA